MKIGIVGVGYVGIHLISIFQKKYNVIGYDCDYNKIVALKKGIDKSGEISSDNLISMKNVSFTSDIKDISEADVTEETYLQKLKVLKYGLENDFDFSTKHIPEEVIDDFVKEIVVCKDCFIWKLNFVPDSFMTSVEGKVNDYKVSQTELTSDMSSQHRLLSQISNLFVVSKTIVQPRFIRG